VAEMTVELVAVEGQLWSGQATAVFTRTTVGEIGILPRHIPLLGELIDNGVVRIDTVDGGQVMAAVQGGFLSVTGRTGQHPRRRKPTGRRHRRSQRPRGPHIRTTRWCGPERPPSFEPPDSRPEAEGEGGRRRPWGSPDT